MALKNHSSITDFCGILFTIVDLRQKIFCYSLMLVDFFHCKLYEFVQKNEMNSVWLCW